MSLSFGGCFPARDHLLVLRGDARREQPAQPQGVALRFGEAVPLFREGRGEVDSPFPVHVEFKMISVRHASLPSIAIPRIRGVRSLARPKSSRSTSSLVSSCPLTTRYISLFSIMKMCEAKRLGGNLSQSGRLAKRRLSSSVPCLARMKARRFSTNSERAFRFRSS